MEGGLRDLRGIAVWERREIVSDAVHALQPEQSFGFVTEVDPRALIGHLEQLYPSAFRFAHRHVGGGEWNVEITRVRSNGSPSSLAHALHRSPVFASLDDAQENELLPHFVFHDGRKGQVLYEEDSRVQELGLLTEGSLGVFIGAGARERLLFQLFPGDTFNEIELLDEGLTLGRTSVLSKNARYATVPADVVRSLAYHNPRFFAAFGAAVAQRARALAGSLAAQVSQPILARVAEALLPYAPPDRGLAAVLPPLGTMTQSQIAAAAGTVKEVAARAIGELEKSGALQREHGHICRLDRPKLLEIAQGS